MESRQDCEGKDYIQLQGWLGCLVFVLIVALCAAGAAFGRPRGPL